MNEITKIHLARVSYDIDVAAKKELEKYLVAIRKSLGDEIDAMEDIEIRMTEILAARGVTKDSVITENDIKAVRKQLGEPSDFAGDNNSKKKDGGTNNGSAAKKFYRDTDNEILGGVIAGLAAYTGWDVTVLRVLAVVFAIFPTHGILIIVYFIIWMVAPAAETASEKLEMRGQTVDIDSIKEQVKNASERVAESGKEVAEKVKKNFATDEKLQNAFGRRNVNPVLHGVLAFFGVIFLIALIPAFVAFVVSMVGVMIAAVSADIVFKALFTASVSLWIACVFMLLVGAISLSVSMIRAKFDGGFVVGIVFSFMMLLAASVCSGVWISKAGSEGVDRAVEVFQNSAVQIENNDGRVKVDIGPFKIDVKN